MSATGVDITESVVRERIRGHILRNYLFTEDGSMLKDAASFRETGTIDSMGMMDLIYFVEEQFQLKVLDEDMVPEKLDSVDRLVRFVLTKRGAK